MTVVQAYHELLEEPPRIILLLQARRAQKSLLHYVGTSSQHKGCGCLSFEGGGP